MRKTHNNEKSQRNKYICEFVNNIIEKDYAKARIKLECAVNSVIQGKIGDILRENQ